MSVRLASLFGGVFKGLCCCESSLSVGRVHKLQCQSSRSRAESQVPKPLLAAWRDSGKGLLGGMKVTSTHAGSPSDTYLQHHL